VGFSGDGGAATSAQLDTPTEIALDRRGNVYFFDKGNRRVRRIGIDGVIRTVAGSRREFGYDDISGRTATDIGLGTVNGLAADAVGNLFLAESTRVTRVDTNGKIRVIWGFMGEDDNGAGTYRVGPISGADAIAWTPEGPVISMRQEGRIVRLVPEI
jgi:internalin A